mmetsp:Transcript_1237/g.2427  ORF Transcript_1237/g.2427 Transcript_1237/m.2427 type:complete len:308 (-) Transcript_1237:1408-2331(-)
MRKDSLGQRDPGTHQQGNPNHGVEPQNIFSNHVHIRWPKFGQFGSIFAQTKSVDSRNVVGQGIQPNVHDVIVIEALGDWDTPRKCGSTDGEISQIVLLETSQNHVAMLLGLNKFRIILNVLDQLVMVLGHFEKVRLFFHPFQGLARCGILKIGELRLIIRDKRFFTNVVPSRILVQINITCCVTPLPQGLRRTFVSIRRRSYIVIKGYFGTLIEYLEARDKLVAHRQRVNAFGRGRIRNLLSVLVGSSQEIHGIVVARKSLVPSNHIRRRPFVGVTHVAWTIGIVNGRGNIKRLFGVWANSSTSRAS